MELKPGYLYLCKCEPQNGNLFVVLSDGDYIFLTNDYCGNASNGERHQNPEIKNSIEVGNALKLAQYMNKVVKEEEL